MRGIRSFQVVDHRSAVAQAADAEFFSSFEYGVIDFLGELMGALKFEPYFSRHALAQRIDTLPAGGNLSNTDLILVLLIAILVVVAL